MKTTNLYRILICLLAFVGTVHATAATYQNTYQPTYQSSVYTAPMTATAPTVTFQSTSAYSVRWTNRQDQPMLNMDGSVNGDSYGIGRKPGLRKEGREDGEGNTGTPGQGGIKQPLGDAVLPLLLMALAFMAYVALRRKKK